ncbi:MAG: phenylalanine--tRNA ligase subunit alpha [Candidatus Krumholzibacteriota bacterium]|nr:phenylalanine--tRNA ligase subunit alpha [Candidatus Krumholzibacteriota bacterium]
MGVEVLEKSLRGDISSCTGLEELETVRIRYLGRKGRITSLLRDISAADPADRPALGAQSNRLKQLFESLYTERKQELTARAPNELYERPIDGTLPASDGSVGRRHVLIRTFLEMRDILHGMGYRLARGPEVELDYYNFQSLNFPEEHPSRDLQDTFYITDDILLRTHTSPVQVRYMESHKPPLKILCPGRVYRNEAIDQSHAAEFHQIEGLYVDSDVSMADLRNDIAVFIQQLFGVDIDIRFKPHFFPFTEPSVDVDMTCHMCRGNGCSVCGNTGWIEIMGAGMVHPNVFRAVGYDPDQYSGFAFGIGVDRVAMIRYGVSDIRLFLENDFRFLNQF